MSQFEITKNKNNTYHILVDKTNPSYIKDMIDCSQNIDDYFLKNLKSIFKQIINQHKTIKFCNLYDISTICITETIIDDNNELNYYLLDYYTTTEQIVILQIFLKSNKKNLKNNTYKPAKFIKSLCKLFIMKLL